LVLLLLYRIGHGPVGPMGPWVTVMGPWGPVKPGLERKPSVGAVDGPRHSGVKTHCVIERKGLGRGRKGGRSGQHCQEHF
jgi:hypothetical protein